MEPQYLLILISLLMLFCIYASKYLSRFGVPILLLFIGIGMFLGSDGFVGIYFDNASMTKEIGNIALAFILFYGGMDFQWKNGKRIVGQGVVLATAGVLLTAAAVGYFAYLITDMPLLECLLLGAIVSSTDAASVFSTLRSQNVALKGSLASLLEFESGSNDPMSFLLTIVMIGIIVDPTTFTAGHITLLLVEEIGFAIIIGAGVGLISVFLLNRIRLNIEGFYPIFGIALVLFIYSFNMAIGGNYFLSIYLAGLIIGNSSFVLKMRFIRFFDGQSWLMQIILFVTLGLQVFPSQLGQVALPGILIALVLILIIRPLIVMPILTLFKVPFKEQLYISLVGFRGAASIVFATYPLIAGVGSANQIFNIVFCIALASIIIQGTMLRPLAQKLDLVVKSTKEYDMKRFNDYAEEIDDIHVLGVYVSYDSPAIGYRLDELVMPSSIKVLAIRQHEKYTIPSHTTRISVGNRLLLTCYDEEVLSDYCREMKFDS
jgi:cell volume regulation protein A